MLTAPVRIQSVQAEYSGHILINQKMELSQNEISPSFMNFYEKRQHQTNETLLPVATLTE